MKKNLLKSLFILVVVIVCGIIAYNMDGRIFSTDQIKDGIAYYATPGRLYTFADIPRVFVLIGMSYLIVTFCISYFKKQGVL